MITLIMRTFVANQQLEVTLESLIKRGVAFSVGLLLGQVTDVRCTILGSIALPGEHTSWTSKSIALILEHAAEVQSMCCGGVSVVGLYALASSSLLEQLDSHLTGLLSRIAPALPGSTDDGERILLTVPLSASRATWRAWASVQTFHSNNVVSAAPAFAIRPAPCKFQKMKVEPNAYAHAAFNVNLSVPIKGKNLSKDIKNAANAWLKEREHDIAMINGRIAQSQASIEQFMTPDAPLQVEFMIPLRAAASPLSALVTALQNNASRIQEAKCDAKPAMLSMDDVVISDETDFSAFGIETVESGDSTSASVVESQESSNSSEVASAPTISSQPDVSEAVSVSAFLTMRGSLTARAFVGPLGSKATVESVVASLRADLCASLHARLEQMYSSISKTDCQIALPARVYVRHASLQFALSIGDSLAATSDRLRAALSLEHDNTAIEQPELTHQVSDNTHVKPVTETAKPVAPEVATKVEPVSSPPPVPVATPVAPKPVHAAVTTPVVQKEKTITSTPPSSVPVQTSAVDKVDPPANSVNMAFAALLVAVTVAFGYLSTQLQ